MGNRAVITTREKRVGVYMHWNGGRDSVEPMLHYCKMLGFRRPEEDSYGFARMCQVIGNFFNDEYGSSVGIDTVDRLDCDNYDNGVYIIEDWEIVGREFFKGDEQASYDEYEVIQGFNENMPEGMKLSEEELKIRYEKLKNAQKKP